MTDSIELSFDITKMDDGMLIIKPSRSFSRDELFDDLIMGDDLFWNDLEYYHSGVDAWQYIYDANRDLLYPMDDYGYDLFCDLMKGDEIKVMGRENNSDYEGYEWRDDQEGDQ